MNWSYWLFGLPLKKLRGGARRRRNPYTQSTRARGRRAVLLDSAIRPGAQDHGSVDRGHAIRGAVILAVVVLLACCCGLGIQHQRANEQRWEREDSVPKPTEWHLPTR